PLKRLILKPPYSPEQRDCHPASGQPRFGPAAREDEHSKLALVVIVVQSVTSRAMRPAFARGRVAVTLVPLFMPEFVSFLRLVFTELRAVPIHLESLLMMVAQTVPFGALVLPFGTLTPISRAAPTGSIGPVIGLSGSIVHRRRCIVARAVAAANLDGKAS